MTHLLRLDSLFFVVLAMIVAPLVGCTSRSPTVDTSTLIYSRGEDANTLDPIHTDIGETVKVLVNIYDTLVTHHDTKAELVPGLAESWQTSADGLTWTFHLRPNVLFHDGTALDADAVVFTFERLLKKEHPYVFEPGRPYQSAFHMIESVKAADPNTVVFTLKSPSAVFLQNLAMFPASIVSPTAVKKHKEKYRENPVGTGPFQLVKWNRDQQLVLKAFDKHWRGPAGVEHVIFLPNRESATRVQQMKRGQAHIADDLPPAELDSLAKQPGIVVQEQVGMNVSYLSMQMQKPPLDQAKVREAIAKAIDKQEFVRIVFAGHAVPAKTLVPPEMWGHHGDLQDYQPNTDEAKQLLEKAAKEAGFELPLKLTLSVMSQPRPYLQQPIAAASYIKDALKPIGIEVTVETRDVNQHFTYVTAGRHELALAGWSSDNGDPDNFLYSLLDPDNIHEHGNNLSRYDNPRVHELLLAAQAELDQGKRLAMYREVQEIALRELPVVPLAHSEMRIAQQDTVQGYVLHPTGLVRLRLARLEASP
jgi:peptide/nickel transport system substrate-binding protein